MSHRVSIPRRSIRKMVTQKWIDGKPILWWHCAECHHLSETYTILYWCMRDVEDHIQNKCPYT